MSTCCLHRVLPFAVVEAIGRLDEMAMLVFEAEVDDFVKRN